MTDKPNAVDEIIATAMAASRRRVVPAGPPPTQNPMNRIQIDGYLHSATAVRAALQANGLKVVPIRTPTDEQIAAMKSAIDLGPYLKTAYMRAIIDFDPTKWKPEE